MRLSYLLFAFYLWFYPLPFSFTVSGSGSVHVFSCDCMWNRCLFRSCCHIQHTMFGGSVWLTLWGCFTCICIISVILPCHLLLWVLVYLSFHLMVFETEVYFGLVIYNMLFAEGGILLFLFLLKRLVYDYDLPAFCIIQVCDLYFITFYSECECTYLFISSLTAFRNWCLFCSCYDIIFYVGEV